VLEEEQSDQVCPAAAVDLFPYDHSVWMAAMRDECAIDRLVIRDGDFVETLGHGSVDHLVRIGPAIG
jgi:hypothetical protein